MTDYKPVIEEPTGLGAVVESRTGNRMVRCLEDDEQPWRDGMGTWYSWRDFRAACVLSEGVQP